MTINGTSIPSYSSNILDKNIEKKEHTRLDASLQEKATKKTKKSHNPQGINNIDNKIATGNINKINESMALLEKVRLEMNNIQAQVQNEETVTNLKDISKSIKNIKYETENIFNNKLVIFNGDELTTIKFSIPFEKITASTNKISTNQFIQEQKEKIDKSINKLEDKLTTRLDENINNLEQYYKTIDIDDEDKFINYIRSIGGHEEIFTKNISTLSTQNEIMYLLS